MASVEPQIFFVKPIGITAAILGWIQGTAWIILGILAASIHLEIWKPRLLDPLATPVTYGQMISWTIGRFYLKADTKLEIELFVTSTTLFGWTVLYLLLSTAWIIISIIQFDTLWSQKPLLSKKYLRKIFFSWVLCAFVICLLDLILTILLATDYAAIVRTVNEGTVGNGSLPLACGIIMSLAAKGFVLWIVNVIFIVLIVILNLKISKYLEVFLNVNNANTDGNSDDNSESFGTIKLYGNPINNWKKERPKFNQNGFYSTLWYYRRNKDDVQSTSTSSTSNEDVTPKPTVGKPTVQSPPKNISSKVSETSCSYPGANRVATPEPDYIVPNKHVVRTRYNIYC